MGDWWARKLGAIPARPEQKPASRGAWWEPGAQPRADAGLRAQMPQDGPAGPGGMPLAQYIRQLRSIPADQLSQDQMEEIARFDLQNNQKYASTCPSCGSGNFVAAGTVLAGTRMGTDKCFDCGGSSSQYVSSPEPARGGGSRAPHVATRQIDTGGAGGSMYLKFGGVPAGYVPRS